jgi:hypothetical protein
MSIKKYDLPSWENGYAAGRNAENERLAQPVIVNAKDVELTIYEICFSTMVELRDLKQSLLKHHEQTKQEPVVGMYRNIFEDYKYILAAFENGADANDYIREIHQAKSDIRKACNWLYPLPTDVIDDLALKSFYAGTFDFRAFARGLEKQHGIGVTDE